MQQNDFGNDFTWGCATAAYQIEGAIDRDGKSRSIWDTFSHTPGKILNGENGDQACRSYDRYTEDLDLLKEMNFQAYRFSIAWTRILPDPDGSPNQKGLDYYERLVDGCLERGLQPWPTLYHWDLPQSLEDQGGWANRNILKAFDKYVDVTTRALGDRVQKWMVLNEPLVFSVAGYYLGMHAPGRKGFRNFLPTVHHIAMAQASGGRIARTNVKGADIGTTFSCSPIHPMRDRKTDQMVARRYDAIINRLYIEPALGMGYPEADFPYLGKIQKYVQAGDMDSLKFDFDFIGIQNYYREKVKSGIWPPLLWGSIVPPNKRGVTDITDMEWEIYPEGMYEILKQFGAYEGVDRIYVTENGAAFPDKIEHGCIKDNRRIDFYKKYLAQVLRAIQDGINVQGYFCWSLLDNFEWAEGFRPRFGLVNIDYANGNRLMKDSGRWFKEFLS